MLQAMYFATRANTLESSAANDAAKEVPMFVAWRELRHARGRFALISAVVALITLLVGFLAGLTGGLAGQNISAVLALPGDRLVLSKSDDGSSSFAASSISDAATKTWQDASGIDTVTAVGITQARAALADAANDTETRDTTGIAVFGLPTDLAEAHRTELTELVPDASDQIVLSEPAAESLNAAKGETVQIAGIDYTVADIATDLHYSHTPIAVVDSGAWHELSVRLGGTGDPTLLTVSGEQGTNFDAIAADTGTSADTALMSLTALESFKSEIGSLGLMIALLFGISALVVGAFFTVWTIQRAGDIAVLKALGATTRSLVRDALGQAAIVLIIGIGIGLLAVVGLGLLAANVLPFELSLLTTALPAVIMAALGLAGAAFALRTVTKADPLTALGSNR